MKRFTVLLDNEDGETLTYYVNADNKSEALEEAWQQYRELDKSDGEMPPPWTNAVVEGA